MTWRAGSGITSLLRIFFLIPFLLGPADLAAGRGYKSVLKKWSRHDKVYTFDNLEMKLAWEATYFSDDFQKVYWEKIARWKGWLGEEGEKKIREEQKQFASHDLFFVAVYAGSSAEPGFGDVGQWRIALETGGKRVESARWERAKITPLEKRLFPYLNKWSKGYWVYFPKVIRENQPFSLKMLGMPIQSELAFK